jgi:hypothetical protein
VRCRLGGRCSVAQLQVLMPGIAGRNRMRQCMQAPIEGLYPHLWCYLLLALGPALCRGS